MTLEKAIKFSHETTKKIKAYRHVISLGHWDLSTLAPKNGKIPAAEAISIISGEFYTISTDEKFHEALQVIIDNKDNEKVTEVMLREAQVVLEETKRTKNIPKDVYQKYQEVKSKSEFVWEEAKNNNDFSSFLPHLEEVVKYTRKVTKLTHPEMAIYDGRLDSYEKGFTTKKLDVFFDEVKKETIPLIKRIAKEGRKIENKVSGKSFDVKKQFNITKKLLEAIGFNMDSGVVAESEHPFTMGLNSGDVRLTTHFHEKNLVSAMFSTIHEGGHGIYMQNSSNSSLVKGTMIDGGASNGIHESQSRFYENIVARSKPFWKNYYPMLQEEFKDELKDVSLDDFYNEINSSKPSLIRTEADELTYNMHIIIRYELERDLMEGKIEAKDIRELWLNKYEEYLGVTPENDTTGVLQDVHWSGGMFGYFPSYALGNAYAAQFFNSMKKDLDFYALLEKGDFKPINNWLDEKIHKYGEFKTPEELIFDVTGEKLNAKYLNDYLKDKYEKIYF